MKNVLKGMVLLSAVVFLSGCGNNNNNKNTNPENKNQLPLEQKVNINKNNENSQSLNNNTNYVVNEGESALFWGQGCPHCENVEKFLEENPDIASKIKLKKFEVFNDQEGQKLFALKAKECGLSSLGVPTLYKDGSCKQGDAPIIEELKK